MSKDVALKEDININLVKVKEDVQTNDTVVVKSNEIEDKYKII